VPWCTSSHQQERHTLHTQLLLMLRLEALLLLVLHLQPGHGWERCSSWHLL
jgi:hypothetical protein